MTEIVSNEPRGQLFIYQASNGKAQIECQFEEENLWLSLNQMSTLFGRDKSVISKHLKNIYEEGELVRNSTIAKYATVQIEGSRDINREIEFYNSKVVKWIKPRTQLKDQVPLVFLNQLTTFNISLLNLTDSKYISP